GVEADLNGCRRLVDMLAAWSARCDKDLFDFRFLNRDRIGDLDHDPPPPGLCCPRTTPARVLRRKGAGVTGARYAVYFAPAEDSALNRLASRWLGRCAYTGTRYPPTGVGEITPAAQEEITAEPRRYGFHATLKPPFRLPQGRTATELLTAVESFAAARPRIILPGLRVARLGRFLALVPERASPELEALAADCVATFDRFRAPPGEAELARRRST